MVGHDDLRRAMSIRVSRSASQHGSGGCATPVKIEEVVVLEDNVVELAEGVLEEGSEKKTVENGGMHHVTIDVQQVSRGWKDLEGYGRLQPSTSKESDQKEEVTPDNHDEVKVWVLDLLF